MWVFIMKRMALARKLMQFVYHRRVNMGWAIYWDGFCGGGCWYVYCCVWFCTHGTNEKCQFIDLLCVLGFASVVILRVDTEPYYRSICVRIQSWSVWLHDAGCELYSSHRETEIFAINVTFSWNVMVIIVVPTDSQSREQYCRPPCTEGYLNPARV